MYAALIQNAALTADWVLFVNTRSYLELPVRSPRTIKHVASVDVVSAEVRGNDDVGGGAGGTPTRVIETFWDCLPVRQLHINRAVTRYST